MLLIIHPVLIVDIDTNISITPYIFKSYKRLKKERLVYEQLVNIGVSHLTKEHLCAILNVQLGTKI